MEVLLQRIESVSAPQGLSRLVFISNVSAPAAGAPLHGVAAPVDSLIMTLADAEAAAFKVNGVYDLLLNPKA